MLDFLKGAANLLAGPMSAAVDLAGNALGLPPLITNSIKAATGVATGNVMMVASGAMGVAKELSQNPAAKTEYRPPSGGDARVGEGYASSSPVLPSGTSPLDPKMLDYADSLRVLEANFAQLDYLDGKKDGSLSKKDLERVSSDASLSPQLRNAARFMLENKALFERLDNGNKLLNLGVMGLLTNDRFNLKDLSSELKRVEGEFSRYGRPERPGRGVPGGGGTPGTGPTPTTGSGPSPTTGSGPSPACDTPSTTPTTGSSGSGLDPDFAEYRDALSVLNANWDTFDAAVGAKDNVLTRDNLAAILNSPAASSTLKRAAQFFKDHPEYYDRLEMANGVGGRDGIVGRPDVTAALRQAGAVQGSSGTPSTTGGGKPVGSGGSSVKSILDNPNMSVEDKIQAILMSIAENTDDELLGVLNDMADQRDQRATLGTSDADKQKAAKIDSSMQELELRLQKLMEKRKAMFELMSNMSSKFHEMAKTAISNLRSA
ncbi:hypothetical protein [Pyxidicoccus caerfyrddinensis]|uniref:hypothetical protein n=1 Tax=Pyxidicoccus caerfyrddinensis TaxID=2709663 RepID=UPI0013DB7567|nr:hypothetical protein [Pyxidicoccus caerfyrddinensis]